MPPQPRCPKCQAKQIYYDALERQYACLTCGWRKERPPLPLVRERHSSVWPK